MAGQESAGNVACPAIARNHLPTTSGVSRRRWWRSREQVARAGHDLGRDFQLGCKLVQQPIVAGEVIEHAEQEIRLARGIPQRLRADTGQRQEAVEPLGVVGQEGEDLNRYGFGRFTRHLRALRHINPFNFGGQIVPQLISKRHPTSMAPHASPGA